MTSYQSALEAALEAMRKASRWIYYRRLAGGDPISEEEELLFRAAAQAKEALQRQEQEPVAWDDRPLLAHCLEAVNAASSAWSDVRNLNGDIDGGKCAAAAALERIAKDRIKELAAQCASPPEPEPEKPAARRLTDEEVEVIVRQQYSTDISPADWARSAIRVAESALATLWGVKLRVWGITLE